MNRVWHHTNRILGALAAFKDAQVPTSEGEHSFGMKKLSTGERLVWSSVAHDIPQSVGWQRILQGVRAEGPGVLDSRDTRGATVLLAAIASGRTALVRRICLRFPNTMHQEIQQGAALAGQNTLHAAIMAADVKTAMFLLQRCPKLLSGRAVGPFFELGQPSGYGESPLFFACCTNQRKLVSAILDAHNGKRLNHINSVETNGNTLAHMCVIHNLPQMYDHILSERQRWAELTKQRKLLPLEQYRNKEGHTCLSLAAKLGNLEMFEHVIEYQGQLEWNVGTVKRTLYPLDYFDNIHGELKGAVEVIAQSEQFELLKSPIIQQLVTVKWDTFGARIFFNKFLVALVFACIFTVGIILQPSPDFTAVEEGSWTAWIGSGGIQPSRLIAQGEGEELLRYLVRMAMEAVVVAGAVLKFRVEAREIMQDSFTSYVSATGAAFVENASSSVFCVSIFAVVLLRLAGSPLQSLFQAVSCLAIASYMLYFLLGFSFCGKMIVAVYKMLVTDVMRFLVVNTVFLFGFSTTLYVLMDGDGFDVFLQRVKDCFLLILGDFDFDHFVSDTHFPTFSVVVFVVYNLLLPIMLLNMLVAMMGYTLDTVNEEAEGRWELERLRILMSIENEMTPRERVTEENRYWVTGMDGKRCLAYEQIVEDKFEKAEAEAEADGVFEEEEGGAAGGYFEEEEEGAEDDAVLFAGEVSFQPEAPAAATTGGRVLMLVLIFLVLGPLLLVLMTHLYTTDGWEFVTDGQWTEVQGDAFDLANMPAPQDHSEAWVAGGVQGWEFGAEGEGGSADGRREAVVAGIASLSDSWEQRQKQRSASARSSASASETATAASPSGTQAQAQAAASAVSSSSARASTGLASSGQASLSTTGGGSGSSVKVATHKSHSHSSTVSRGGVQAESSSRHSSASHSSHGAGEGVVRAASASSGAAGAELASGGAHAAFHAASGGSVKVEKRESHSHSASASHESSQAEATRRSHEAAMEQILRDEEEKRWRRRPT